MSRDAGYSSRELFTDREMVKSFRNVDFRLNHPERCDDYFRPEEPYCTNLTGAGTILPLENGKWRMYFRGGYNWKTPFRAGEENKTPCLSAAESEDGIRWRQVTKESIIKTDSFAGLSANVLNASVFLDTNPSAPRDERFKMLFAGFRSEDCHGLMLAVSEDGLNFRLKFENPLKIQCHPFQRLFL